MKIAPNPILSQKHRPARTHKTVAQQRIKSDGRWRLATAAVCGAALLSCIIPAQAAPSARARQAAKECKATYNQELTKVQSLQLTATERETRTNAAYNDLAACLKANHMLSMLPKRPAAAMPARNQQARRSGASAIPSPTPAAAKTPWMKRSASQTGTNL
jgi:hypothetical protein